MSTLTGSVYGWPSEKTEDQMDIDRRSFLTGGLACAGLAVLPGKHPANPEAQVRIVELV